MSNQTPEQIAKRVEAVRKAKEAWTEERYCLFLERLSASHKGYFMPKTQKDNISKAMKGKRNSLGCKRSLEFRKHLSEYWKDNPNHNHWVDGNGEKRCGERNKIMSRLEYRLWRTSVFERDNYTCQLCGEVGGQLHADHIKPYCISPELVFDINNGRTLCVKCHKSTDTYAWKMAAKLRTQRAQQKKVAMAV
jgi:hypothetical protein